MIWILVPAELNDLVAELGGALCSSLLGVSSGSVGSWTRSSSTAGAGRRRAGAHASAPGPVAPFA